MSECTLFRKNGELHGVANGPSLFPKKMKHCTALQMVRVPNERTTKNASGSSHIFFEPCLLKNKKKTQK